MLLFITIFTALEVGIGTTIGNDKGEIFPIHHGIFPPPTGDIRLHIQGIIAIIVTTSILRKEKFA